jgi:hypothetical protein
VGDGVGDGGIGDGEIVGDNSICVAGTVDSVGVEEIVTVVVGVRTSGDLALVHATTAREKIRRIVNHFIQYLNS